MNATTNFEKANELLDKLRHDLESALESAQELAKLLGDDPANVGPGIDSYLVGTLEGFLENSNQPGSVPCIEEGLQELQEMEQK